MRWVESGVELRADLVKKGTDSLMCQCIVRRSYANMHPLPLLSPLQGPKRAAKSEETLKW